jgi:excisionase family DNA binding protein
MTIQEASQRLGKSESTVRRWIRQGKLTATMVGGVYDIPETVVNDYLNDQSMTRQVEGVDQPMIDQLKAENEYLKERIQELEDARQRSDTIVLQLTRQLEQSQRLLEYHRDPWYRRWFRKRQPGQE